MRHLNIVLVAFALILPGSAHAHKAWLLPSTTTMSGESAWITVDAAVSNDLFFFEHRPLQLDGLTIVGPDGEKVSPQHVGTGQFRSTFDVELKRPGTYKMAIVSDGLFANYEKDGETKRWRGKAEDMAKEIPQDAKNLEITQSHRRVETYATLGAPNQVALEWSGVGLEFELISHPNDLIVSENAVFALRVDGKPMQNVEISVIRGGVRYRNDPGSITVTTDQDGKFSVKWPEPGMYWLEASVSDDKVTLAPATKRRLVYALTVEVLPE